MNNLLTGTILACGLLLLESPQASAHDAKGIRHHSSDYRYAYDYRRDYYGGASHSREYYSRNADDREYRDKRPKKRSKKMPNWLKRDRFFRYWLDATNLDKNRYLSWDQLFDIYLWEHNYHRYRR